MPISDALRRTRAGEPVTYEGLTMVPLLGADGAAAPARYDTLGRAIAAGTARVTELTESGTVGTIAVVNAGSRPMLLVDGEQLVGARQNRIVNVTILVAASTRLEIPVSCVEAGRWANPDGVSGPASFRSGDVPLHGSARRDKSGRVSENMRAGRGRDAEQGRIWEEVAGLGRRVGASSPSGALDDFVRHRGASVEEYVARLGAVDGQVGAVFLVHGAAVAVELFVDAATLADYLPKLVRSWAVELVGEAAAAAGDGDVAGLIDDVCRAAATRHPGAGLGEDVRLDDARVTGAALVHDGAVVHLAAFRKPGGEGDGLPGRGRRDGRGERPRDNREVLRQLSDAGGIRLQGVGGLLARHPEPLDPALAWERVEGMLLGLAIGDALGNRSEGMTPADRRARYGEIRDYLPHPHAGGARVGLPSDDTQLAFWTLEQALADGGLDPAALARRFCGGRIFGIGRTVREFVANHRGGMPWHRAAPASAGNGALMRIAPVLVPHLARADRPSRALWADAALAAMVTHDDRSSTAACVAFTGMLWTLLGMREAPRPEWWLDTFVALARPLEGDAMLRSRVPGDGYEGPLWRFVDTRVREALRRGVPTAEACDGWQSGAFLLETAPSALYILARHGDDAREAIVRAVNDTWDNDTAGAIVGAAVGALHGPAALPARWRDGLLGRTADDDDGRVQRLIAAARARWGGRAAVRDEEPLPGDVNPPDRGWPGEAAPVAPVARPIPNAYVVREGVRLVAGEYPGIKPEHGREEADAKLAAFLDAGVDTFVDLTEARELAPYAGRLRAMAGARGVRVEHHRLPIRDMDVCDRAQMTRVLDLVDARLAAGRTVYVHCWGGVGRTGTVVGCWLVRHGLGGDAALGEVQALFDTMTPAKRRKHARSGSPQTDAQREMVRTWGEASATRQAAPATPAVVAPPVAPVRESDERAATRDRVRGALVGLAVGDAVGTTVEFRSPGTFPPVTDMTGGGPFGLKAGQWTDDTSLALCLAESLVACGGMDPLDQIGRYLRWWKQGHLSSTGRCFDIGGTTSAALRLFERTGNPYCGSFDAHTAGNGSLMRLAPVAMWYRDDPLAAITMCAESSRTTHGTPVAVDACRYLGALLVGAMRGATKAELLASYYTPVHGYWEAYPLGAEIAEIAAGSFLRKRPPAIRGAGYAAASLEAALWAFASTDDFRSGCLAAVNLGEDADTTAAVYGQVAGAYYGEGAIPAEWRERLALREVIDGLAEGVWGRGSRPAAGHTPAPASATD